MMLRCVFVLVSRGLNPERRDRSNVAKVFYPEGGRTNRMGGEHLGQVLEGGANVKA